MFYFLIIIEDYEIHSLQEEQLVLAWKSKSLLLKAFFKKKNSQKQAKTFFFLNFPQCSVISCSSRNLNSLHAGPWKNNSLCYWSKEVTPHCTVFSPFALGAVVPSEGGGLGRVTPGEWTVGPSQGRAGWQELLVLPLWVIPTHHDRKLKLTLSLCLSWSLGGNLRQHTIYEHTGLWHGDLPVDECTVRNPSLNMTHRRSGCQPHDKEKQ